MKTCCHSGTSANTNLDLLSPPHQQLLHRRRQGISQRPRRLHATESKRSNYAELIGYVDTSPRTNHIDMSIYPDPDPNRDPNYDPIHPDLDIDTSRDLSYTNNNYGGDLQQTTTLTLTNDPALTPISLEIPIANHVDTHDFQQFSHHVTPSRRSSPNPSKGSPKMADTMARRSSQQGSKVKQRMSSSNTLGAHH